MPSKTQIVAPHTIIAGFGSPPRPLTVQEFVSLCLRGRRNITKANMATAFAAGVHWCNDGFFRLDTQKSLP